MNLIEIVRKVINPLKLDLKIYPDTDVRRRRKLLDFYKINTILDVGANSGQYGEQTIKDLAFKGKLISFEPVKKTFDKLSEKANSYSNWTVYNYGFGNKNEELSINLSENTYSSSLMNILPTHVKSAPESKVVGKEIVKIKTLDLVYNDLIRANDCVLLKIDVQGFEKNVLEGAQESLKHVKGVQVEMSIEELYQDEMLYLDMLLYMKKLGFDLCSLENGFYNEKSGKLLQVDGVFFKTNTSLNE